MTDIPEKKNPHRLADHLLGMDPTHSHEDGQAGHDHDHDDLGGEYDPTSSSLWLQDNITLVSVGIDIGSAGTQVIFSRVQLRRFSEELTSRYFVVGRETLYQSPVALTPYLSEERIDDQAIGRIIDSAYEAAGIHPDRVDIHIAAHHLKDVLENGLTGQRLIDKATSQDDLLTLTVPARLKRTGMEMKMLVDGETPNKRKADRSLVRLIVKAHALKDTLTSGGTMDLSGMTKRWGTGRFYFTRLIKLTFLAPDIIKAILEGRHPKELTAIRLMRETRFPLDWREQREALGFE